MEMTFFNVLWFFLIFVLIGGYFVLDGFDLGGSDVLSLVLAKLGECSGQHVLSVQVVRVLCVGSCWKVHDCGRQNDLMSCFSASWS